MPLTDSRRPEGRKPSHSGCSGRTLSLPACELNGETISLTWGKWARWGQATHIENSEPLYVPEEVWELSGCYRSYALKAAGQTV